jgi:hypothetical protein
MTSKNGYMLAAGLVVFLGLLLHDFQRGLETLRYAALPIADPLSALLESTRRCSRPWQIQSKHGGAWRFGSHKPDSQQPEKGEP